MKSILVVEGRTFLFRNTEFHLLARMPDWVEPYARSVKIVIPTLLNSSTDCFLRIAYKEFNTVEFRPPDDLGSLKYTNGNKVYLFFNEDGDCDATKLYWHLTSPISLLPYLPVSKLTRTLLKIPDNLPHWLLEERCFLYELAQSWANLLEADRNYEGIDSILFPRHQQQIRGGLVSEEALSELIELFESRSKQKPTVL